MIYIQGMRKENSLVFAFNHWTQRAARDFADSMGNLTICKHTVAMVLAAVGVFQGRRGVAELAALAKPERPVVRRPISLKRNDGLLHPEPS